nr:nitrite/sulfite reductase [Deinobacterium chartae]
MKKEVPPFEILEDIYRYAREGRIDPERIDLLKWYGMYPQRPAEDGHLMLRVKIPSGKYSAQAMRALAGISEEFGRGFLDVSDRQAFQFHYLRIEQIPEIFERLEAVGLHSKGACGDTVRAVIASPTAGLDAREVLDVTPLSEQLHHHFSGNPEFGDLPRKFKLSITGTPELEGIHLVNDIGFLAHRVGDRVGFDVWVGGGLGAVAHLAERLGVFVAPEEVLEVARAITAAYRDHGYRINRKKSRLKYLIIDLGVEKFRELVEREYLGRRLEDGPPAPVAPNGGVDLLGVHPQKDGRYYIGVATTVGRINPAKARALADIAERYGAGELRNTPFQNIVLPHVPAEHLEAVQAALNELDLRPEPTLRGTTIACTGVQFCRLALTETKQRTSDLVNYLEPRFRELGAPITINLTGCSNACTRYQVADLGFMGASHAGEEVYMVHLAGGIGEAQRLGTRLKGRVPASELHLYAERALEEFRRHRLQGESFVRFVDRVGSDRFLPDVLLARAEA